MQEYQMKNEELTVTIGEVGAEIHSVRENKTGLEYMWNADPDYWKRTAPVLFPFVGSLKNKEYQYLGKTYPMGQHGFARDMVFEVLKKEETELWFCLKSNQETKQKYPFDFDLKIGYILSKRSITVLWHISNCSDEKMYFSIGAHPAFLCPIRKDEKQTDYEILFEPLEKGKAQNYLEVTPITSTGLAGKEKYRLHLIDGKMKIEEHLFDKDALVIEDGVFHKVSLLTPDQLSYVSVEFSAPLFGIWSPAGKKAPFICIEPWYGRCDAEDFEGTLEQREWGNVLEAGKEFKADYRMIFHKL